MKQVLNEIVKALEDTATSIAAVETALIDRGFLTEGDLDLYNSQRRSEHHQRLAKLRNLVASLPAS
jgi:hypothetical protein